MLYILFMSDKLKFEIKLFTNRVGVFKFLQFYPTNVLLREEIESYVFLCTQKLE